MHAVALHLCIYDVGTNIAPMHKKDMHTATVQLSLGNITPAVIITIKLTISYPNNVEVAHYISKAYLMCHMHKNYFVCIYVTCFIRIRNQQILQLAFYRPLHFFCNCTHTPFFVSLNSLLFIASLQLQLFHEFIPGHHKYYTVTLHQQEYVPNVAAWCIVFLSFFFAIIPYIASTVVFACFLFGVFLHFLHHHYIQLREITFKRNFVTFSFYLFFGEGSSKILSCLSTIR